MLTHGTWQLRRRQRAVRQHKYCSTQAQLSRRTSTIKRPNRTFKIKRHSPCNYLTLKKESNQRIEKRNKNRNEPETSYFSSSSTAFTTRHLGRWRFQAQPLARRCRPRQQPPRRAHRRREPTRQVLQSHRAQRECRRRGT